MKVSAALTAAFGFVLIGGLSKTAAGQDDVSQRIIPSLELQQADVREAIRALFKNVNVSYSIAPDVQGSVTVNLTNITFETALQNILRQLDATYRVEGGVYEIVKRTQTASPIPNEFGSAPSVKTTITRRIKIRSADPQFIAMMLGMKGGNQSYSVAPEMSTIVKTSSSHGSMGGGTGGGGVGGSGSGSGFGSGSSGSGTGSLGSGSSGSGGLSSGRG